MASMSFSLGKNGRNSFSDFIAYIIAGILFFCAGISVILVGTKKIASMQVPDNYVAIEAKVDMYGTVYYVVDGVEYKEHNWEMGSMKTGLRDCVIYYDPNNPEEAIAYDKSGIMIESILMICLGAVVSSFGSYMAIKAIVYNPWRKESVVEDDNLA